VKYDPWKQVVQPTRRSVYFLPRVPHRSRDKFVLLLVGVSSIALALLLAFILYKSVLALNGLC
jgi:hypothetical protein